MKSSIRRVILILSTILIVISVLLLFYFDKYRTVNNPHIKKIVLISPGENISDIAKILKVKGIIKNEWNFILLAKYYEVNIKAGEYELYTSTPLRELLNILERGRSLEHRVTIPEGYNIYQIGKLLENDGICDSKSFIKAAFNKDLIHSLGIDGISVEGYLFPDTYYFRKGIPPEDIIKKMVSHFNEIYLKKYYPIEKRKGMNKKDIIILASIIEKEAFLMSEKFRVSSVLHNRLKIGMRLQSDPTVIYGIFKDFNGNIRKRDLKKPTPFNTYVINGLPIGPICNPGEESIIAALYPAKSNYLYFVSKNDGTHYYSTNLREHNLAVRKYQKLRIP